MLVLMSSVLRRGGYDNSRTLFLTFSEFTLQSTILEATGGLGVDCVLDLRSVGQKRVLAGVSDANVINVLAVFGKWITSQPVKVCCWSLEFVHDHQLEREASDALYKKSASIAWLNVDTWTLSATHLGRFLHILQDFVRLV
jgi:hypothetical protein